MKKYLVANWKTNGNLASNFKLIEGYKNITSSNLEIIVASPHVYISKVVEQLKQKDNHFNVAGQDCSKFHQGSYTGEVSAYMLKDVGASYVILGHSERRHYFHDTDQIISQKVEQALKADLKVVLCVGESLNERDAGVYLSKIMTQLDVIIGSNSEKFLIAYEPVWSIGTGKIPTIKQTEEVVRMIKTKYSNPVLYGGSVNAKNAKSILEINDLAGLLIGGASLDIQVFQDIARVIR